MGNPWPYRVRHLRDDRRSRRLAFVLLPCLWLAASSTHAWNSTQVAGQTGPQVEADVAALSGSLFDPASHPIVARAFWRDWLQAVEAVPVPVVVSWVNDLVDIEALGIVAGQALNRPQRLALGELFGIKVDHQSTPKRPEKSPPGHIICPTDALRSGYLHAHELGIRNVINGEQLHEIQLTGIGRTPSSPYRRSHQSYTHQGQEHFPLSQALGTATLLQAVQEAGYLGRVPIAILRPQDAPDQPILVSAMSSIGRYAPYLYPLGLRTWVGGEKALDQRQRLLQHAADLATYARPQIDHNLQTWAGVFLPERLAGNVVAATRSVLWPGLNIHTMGLMGDLLGVPTPQIIASPQTRLKLAKNAFDAQLMLILTRLNETLAHGEKVDVAAARNHLATRIEEGLQKNATEAPFALSSQDLANMHWATLASLLARYPGELTGGGVRAARAWLAQQKARLRRPQAMAVRRADATLRGQLTYALKAMGYVYDPAEAQAVFALGGDIVEAAARTARLNPAGPLSYASRAIVARRQAKGPHAAPGHGARPDHAPAW